MSEADPEAKVTGDSPPGVLPDPGTTHPSLSTGTSPMTEQVMNGMDTSLTLIENSPLSLREDTNHGILAIASSTSTAFSPTESSSTEGRPGKGTPMTVEANTPGSQLDNGAEEFLNSMAAVLDPSKGEGMKQSPVRPWVRLPPVSGPTVGSSFASVGSSDGTFGTSPVSSRILGSKASPARMSSAESSRIAAILPQSFKTQMVLDCEPSKPVPTHHGIGLGVSVLTPALSAGLFPPGAATSSILPWPMGPPKQGQKHAMQSNESSVLEQGNQLNCGQVCFAEILLEALPLTIDFEDDPWISCIGGPVPIGCAVLLWSSLHHGSFVAAIYIQVRWNKRKANWRTSCHVWAHYSGSDDLGLGVHGPGGGL